MTGWTYRFNAWTVLRHAALVGDAELVELPVHLEGRTADGDPFKSDVTVVFDVHVQSSDHKRKLEQRFND